MVGLEIWSTPVSLPMRPMIKKERNMIASPAIAQVKVFLALSTLPGSPFDVIYLAPEKIKRIRAITPAKTRDAVIRFFIMIGIQASVATSPFSRQASHIRDYFPAVSVRVGSSRLKILSPKRPSTKLRIKNAKNTITRPITAAMI